MNTAVMATRLTRGSVVQFRPNQSIEQHMKALKKNRAEMKSLNKYLRKLLDMKFGWGQSIFGRIFGRMIPRRLYGVVPAGILKWVAEEADVLEQIEGMKRESINRSQEVVANIGECAMTESGEIEKLISDIGKAEKERWDARKLHEYMVSESSLEINPTVSELLDAKFEIFTDEQKEKQRQDFIDELKILAQNRRKLIKALADGCDVCLSQLNAEVREYYSFSRVYRPIAVIRNSVKGMLETDRSLYVARQALMETMLASAKGIDTIIQGVSAT